MMRIGLFLLTNIAVIALASITLSLFGVGSILQANGVNLDLGTCWFSVPFLVLLAPLYRCFYLSLWLKRVPEPKS